MKKITFNEVENLLPGYLSGDLFDTDRLRIDEWRKESPENEEFYRESLKAWDAIPLLHEMEQFNSFQALEKVNSRIYKSNSVKWWIYIQRIAAILLLPGYIAVQYKLNHIDWLCPDYLALKRRELTPKSDKVIDLKTN